MNTYRRLIFMSKMHFSFQCSAFAQIERGELWDMAAWAYLMGGEL